MSTTVICNLNKKPNVKAFGTVVVNRIDNPFDPITSKVTKTDLHGAKLSTYLEGYCLANDPEGFIVKVNKTIVKDMDYIVQPNDVISYVNVTQGGGGGGGKNILTTIAMIALVVVATLTVQPWLAEIALGMGATAGAAAFIGGMGAGLFVMAGGMLINSMISSSASSAITDTNPELESSTYSWNGITTNRSLNKPIPVLYGTHALGGTVINSRIYYNGTDDWIGTQIALCHGRIQAISSSDITINDSKYSSFAGNNSARFSYRIGTFDQECMVGYDDSIYNNSAVTRELKYNTEYMFESVSTNINFFRIHIMFPAGLYNIDKSNGNKTSKSVTLNLSYRKKGTLSWTPIYYYDTRGTKEYKYTYQEYVNHNYSYTYWYDDVPYTYTYEEWGEWVPGELWSTDPNLSGYPGNANVTQFSKTSEVRYNPNIAFVPTADLVFEAKSSVPIKQAFEPVDTYGRPILLEAAQYEFRAIRLTADDTEGDNYAKSTSTLRFLEEVNTTNINYGGIALLGIDLKATNQLNSSRPNFVTVCKRADLFLKGAYRPSTNPAWITYDILTNKHYGMGLDESEIDGDEFIRWGDFCDGVKLEKYTLTIPPTIATYNNTRDNCIIIRGTDLPGGERIDQLSQIDLNNSTLSAKGIRFWGDKTLSVNSIIGVNTKFLFNDPVLGTGLFVFLEFNYNIRKGSEFSYSLSINYRRAEDRPKLSFNGVFDTSTDIWTALQDVAQIGRGQIILRGNKYSCIFDGIKTVKGLYNAANSTNVTVQYLNSADVASEIELQFTDKALNYEMNSISIQDADMMTSGARSVKTTRQVKGITSEADAVVYGKYLLATSKYIRRVITLDADIEAITQTVGDLIAVQTDVTQYGIGGLVDKVLGNFVYLDNKVTLEKGKTYTLKLKSSKTDEIRQFEFVAESSTNTLTFDSLNNTYVGDLVFDDFILKMDFESDRFLDTSVIVLTGAYDVLPEDRYSFGVKGSDSILCTISDISRDGDYNRKITAVEYNESILDFNSNNDVMTRLIPTLKPTNKITNFTAKDRLVKLAAGQVVAMISFGWEALISSYYNIYLLEENGFKHYLGNNIKDTRFEYPNTVLLPEKSYTIYIEDLNDNTINSYINYTVTSFSAPPENITGITLTSTDANVIFNINYPNKPLDFSYYNVYRNGILISKQISDKFEIRHVLGSSAIIYEVEVVDLIGKKSAKFSKTFTPTAPTINTFTYTTIGDNIKLSLTSTKGSFDIDYYSLTYNSTTVIIKDLSVLVKADFIGTKTFSIKATDILGNTSAVVTLDITLSVPSPSNLKSIIEGKEVVISWDIPSSALPIDYYELTYDSMTVKAKTNSFRLPVMWLGSKTFNVATVNSLGNKSTAVSISATITAPTVTSVQTEVIDNNVLLKWIATAGSLPIDNFIIYKGPNINSLVSIGEKMGTFTTIFETSSGTYTYWVAAVDSAGNIGTKISAVASVNQPPDYILNTYWRSTFSGTKVNAKIDNGYLVLPINTTETIQQHFVNNSWTTAQAQVASGNTLWIQPFLSAGSYEETFDYGAVLASTLISVVINTTNVVGTPTVTPTISVSTNGTTWTDYVGQYQVYGGGFRYVKVKIAVTGSNNGLLLKSLEVKLDSKISNDSGSGYSAAPITTTSITGNGTIATCVFADKPIAPYQVGQTIEITGAVPTAWNNKYVVTSCSTTQVQFSSTTTTTATTQGTINAGGTIVKFNKSFVDITSISVTPAGTTPIIGIYDFVDAANPTFFKVLLYDTSGNRVSANYSWSAKGY